MGVLAWRSREGGLNVVVVSSEKTSKWWGWNLRNTLVIMQRGVPEKAESGPQARFNSVWMGREGARSQWAKERQSWDLPGETQGARSLGSTLCAVRNQGRVLSSGGRARSHNVGRPNTEGRIKGAREAEEWWKGTRVEEEIQHLAHAHHSVLTRNPFLYFLHQMWWLVASCGPLH